MSARATLDLARCDALAARGAAGDEAAVKELIEALWPFLIAVVRGSRIMGSLARSEDNVHDVLAKIVEKLSAKEGHTLRLLRSWRERNPDKTLEDWLNIVAANAVRDSMRAHVRTDAEPRDPGAKRLLNEFEASGWIERLGFRPPLTAAQTARQLLEFAEKHVAPDAYRALVIWIEGGEFEDVRQELDLHDEDAARKLVRAAIAVLRRHFANPPQGS